jgi:hypothetical protein
MMEKVVDVLLEKLGKIIKKSYISSSNFIRDISAQHNLHCSYVVPGSNTC